MILKVKTAMGKSMVNLVPLISGGFFFWIRILSYHRTILLHQFKPVDGRIGVCESNFQP